MSIEEHPRYILFRELAKGLLGHKVVLAVNKLTPGIDYRGCSKQHMAEAFARDGYGLGRVSEASLREVLEKLRG